MENGFSKEGRLEIFHKGVWGTICDEGFNQAAAMVACRQLGFRHGGATFHGSAYWGLASARTPIHTADITCTGHEENLSDCSINWKSGDCNHYQDVGVICGLRKEEPVIRRRLKGTVGGDSVDGDKVMLVQYEGHRYTTNQHRFITR